MFSLKLLNLSSNQIEVIDENSFGILNILDPLDLRMGLLNVKDLHLLDSLIVDTKLDAQSLVYLKNINNIYLDCSA